MQDGFNRKGRKDLRKERKGVVVLKKFMVKIGCWKVEKKVIG